MISELVEEALDNPSKRILKVLNEAEELGWTTGVVSVCVRLSKPDDKPDRIGEVAFPFYATWILKGWTPTGKPSWSFQGSRASNGQALSEADILLYLKSPEIIHPDFEDAE